MFSIIMLMALIGCCLFSLPVIDRVMDEYERGKMENHTITTPGAVVTVKSQITEVTTTDITATFDVQVDDSLQGRRIHVSAASRKYAVPHGTISRWVQSGYIRVLERNPNTLHLNEFDIARVSGIYHAARRIASPEKAGWLLKQALST